MSDADDTTQKENGVVSVNAQVSFPTDRNKRTHRTLSRTSQNLEANGTGLIGYICKTLQRKHKVKNNIYIEIL
jgi:hypothetical protein